MDIVNNDYGLLINLLALICSIFLLGIAAVAVWILIVEFNIFLHNRKVLKEYAKITKEVEELRNDFE